MLCPAFSVRRLASLSKRRLVWMGQQSEALTVGPGGRPTCALQRSLLFGPWAVATGGAFYRVPRAVALPCTARSVQCCARTRLCA